MKVTELSCFAVDIPAKHGSYVMSHGRVLHTFPTTIVKVTAEDGTIGYGEACTLGGNYLDGHPGSARATVRALADWALECDPLDPGLLVDGMDERLIGHLPGKAAIDTALWDLRGKLLGQPVSRLLGGVRQSSFEAFQAISLGAPAEMAEELRRVADLGIRRYQLKLGNDPIEDAARVHAIVAVQPPDTPFLTGDANGGWTVAAALRYANAVRGVDIYLEQPCRTIAELARVRERTSLPVIIDESARDSSDLLDAILAKSADALNLKPTRVGGLTKAARIRDLAETAGLMTVIDEPQGADLATAAMAQLASTVRPDLLLGVGYFLGEHMPHLYQPKGADSGPQLVDGVVSCGELPGLGVEIDEPTLGAPAFTVYRDRRSGT